MRAQVKETVRDVAFLHSEQFFAAAQRKHVYIYDKRGLEVHCLKVGALCRAVRSTVPSCVMQQRHTPGQAAWRVSVL